MSTESFESVAKSYDNYTWIGRDGVKRAIDRLKAAHDREIRDAAQKEYHRGFEDGRRSMDAEHRAVAMRLRALPMNKVGYAVNLFDIEYAVCNDWNDVEFRDKLIDLMGGVSDGTTEPMTTDEFIECINQDTRRLKGDGAMEVSDDTCDSQYRGACDADRGGDSGEQKEVGDGRLSNMGVCLCGGICDNPAGESGVKHGGTSDDSGADTGCGDGCGDLHMAGVTHDVLWNERRKAIASLRKWEPDKAIANDHCGDIQIRLLYQLLGLGGAMMMDGADAAKKVRDRLIHLLGGDKPNGIDVMREMAECEAECRITDELRKWADGDVWSCRWEEFKVIADRIDEQFDRICQQQEAVLQETIDGMVELPRDANGEVFRVDGGARVDDLVLTIRQMTLTKSGWKIRAYDENYEVEREASFFNACAPNPDIIEEVIERLTLGEITQSEAIERIKSCQETVREK